MASQMTTAAVAAAPARPKPYIRASLACQSCRRRKVKCDVQDLQSGQQCTPCQQTNTDCVVDSTSDRRKSGSRRHIATLEKRVHSLEALLRQDAAWRRSTSCEDRSDGIRPRAAGSSAPSGEDATDASHSPNTSNVQDVSMTNDECTDCINVQLQSPSPAPYSPTRQPATTVVEEDDMMQLQLLQQEPSNPSPPGHSIGQHGGALRAGEQPRGPSTTETVRENAGRHCSFGPTSPLHLLSASSEHQPIPMQDDLATSLGIAVDLNSARMRDHLLQSYFKYQTLWASVVDQRTFLEHRAQEASFWYSPFLETVLLASAARLSTSDAIRSLSREYASRARAEIPVALETPSAATLQGFLLLSEYEVTQGRDRVGWMLCGMACRMITDLGLHEIPLCGASINDSCLPEGVLLHRLLCACISYEGIWCIYLGRPSSIPRSVMDVAFARTNNDRGPEAAMLAAWVGLCIPMGEICQILNYSVSLDSRAAGRLSDLDAELRKWQSSLPPSIAHDENCLMDLDPVAFGLHMQYYKVQILVHRAISGTVGAEKCTTSQGLGQETSRQIVLDTALKIVRLLVTYYQIHGAEEVPSIMLDSANLALTTLVAHSLDHPNPGASAERDFQWIRLSVDTLQAVQPHFPVVQRMLHTLEQMVNQTHLADLFSAAPSPRKPRRPVSDCAEGSNLGSIGDLVGSFSMDGPSDVAFGNSDRFDPGNQFLDQMLDCGWLPHDPGEASASLLSFPSLQLASLWLPATGGTAEG